MKAKICRYCTQLYFCSRLQCLFFFFFLSSNNLGRSFASRLRHPAIQATQTENHCHRNVRNKGVFSKPLTALSSLRSRAVAIQGLSLHQQQPCDIGLRPRLWWQTKYRLKPLNPPNLPIRVFHQTLTTLLNSISLYSNPLQ